MKILHVIGSLALHHGGPSVLLPGWLSALTRCGHEIHLLTTSDGLSTEYHGPLPAMFSDEGVTYHIFPTVWPRRFLTAPALPSWLARMVPQMDVVHLHSIWLFHDWVTGRACRHYLTPYVITPHGAASIAPSNGAAILNRMLCDMAFEKRNWRNANLIHFATEGERKAASGRLGSISSLVIPFGVAEFPGPLPNSLADLWPETKGRVTVLFLARLNRLKGFYFILDVFQKAVAIDPRLHLILAGPNENSASTLKDAIASRGLEPHVTVTGLVRDATKEILLQHADIFVAPSEFDSFGMGVAEALSRGRPSIISDNVLLSESTRDAAIVLPLRQEAWAEVLVRLAREPDTRESLSSKAIQLAEDQFSWSKIAVRWSEVYESMTRHDNEVHA